MNWILHENRDVRDEGSKKATDCSSEKKRLRLLQLRAAPRARHAAPMAGGFRRKVIGDYDARALPCLGVSFDIADRRVIESARWARAHGGPQRPGPCRAQRSRAPRRCEIPEVVPSARTTYVGKRGFARQVRHRFRVVLESFCPNAPIARLPCRSQELAHGEEREQHVVVKGQVAIERVPIPHAGAGLTEMIKVAPELEQTLGQVRHRSMASSLSRRIRRRNGSRSAARSCTSRTKVWSASRSVQRRRSPVVTIRRPR